MELLHEMHDLFVLMASLLWFFVGFGTAMLIIKWELVVALVVFLLTLAGMVLAGILISV